MTPFRKVFSLLNRLERRNAVILVLMMLLGMMLETLGVGIVIPALAVMLQSDIGAKYPSVQPLLAFFGNPTSAQLLVAVMMALVAIYAVKNTYVFFLAWRQMRFAFELQADLAKRLFNIYLRQPYTFHLQKNSAQLINNVTSEVNVFTLVVNSSLTFATETLVLLAISALLLTVEPIGAIIVVAVLGIAGGIFHYATRSRLTRWGEARQYHSVLLVQHLQQGLGGVKDVKLMGREVEFVRQYAVHNQANARIAGLQTLMQQLPRLWLELLAIAGLAILVQTMLIQGRDLTTIVSTVGLFAAAAFRLMPSAMRIIGSIQTLRFSMPAVDTVYRELQYDAPTLHDPARNLPPPAFERAIQLRDIAYRYPNASSMALDNLSITIPKGAFVGIIGPSGSGKSTAVDLILGLLTPTAGHITVDDRDIQTCLRSWQNNIGYVPQSIYLTDDSLRRNVAFGLPDAQIDDDAVRRALTAAQLMEFVSTLPEGLETVVGERGVRLSGGQRQRIGIARALYHSPGILILDEATSALDNETETEVMEAVLNLKGKNTIVVVAHRLSTVENCDRLYRIDKGTLVEQGTPAEFGIGRLTHTA